MLEARKSNGDFYPLYAISCGLLRYVRDRRPELNFFKDPIFQGFPKTLDSEMKRLTSFGVGVKRRQAEPISVEEEDLLWEMKLLGDHSLKVLVDTMVYLCGICFALRSGAEHPHHPTRTLNPTKQPATMFSVYRRFFQNNIRGGIAHRKIQPKRVHSNIENPSRCLVKLYQTYMNHGPKEHKTTAFYLTPLKNFS